MKGTFLFLIAFIAGFLVHAFFLPNVLYGGIKKSISPDQKISSSTEKIRSLFIYSMYNGENFNPANIELEKGQYIVIRNIAKTNLMWLQSENPLLSTPRGYAEGEELKQRLDQSGYFTVTEKMNSQAKLHIVVK